MSWHAYHRRRAAIAAVIDHAQRDPSGGLPYESLPEVVAVFGSRTDLIHALQHDWSQSLWAQIETISRTTRSRLVDAAAVCREAWNVTATSKPTLRRLLDQHQDEVLRTD